MHEGLCQQDLGKRALGFPTVRKKEKGGAGAHETRAEGQLSEPAQRGAEATTEGRLKSWHILLEFSSQFGGVLLSRVSRRAKK